MQEKKLRRLLSELKDSKISIDDAVAALGAPPFQDIGFAKIDHHRELRCGQGEVIFCEGKTPEQVASIARAILAESDTLLGTRATPEHYRAAKEKCPEILYNEKARCILTEPDPADQRGDILVITAGTGDIPVGEEAKVTAETLGAKARMISDVGVAGIHRLLRYRDDICNANAVVVVAGMEGALPSVVGGLSPTPVIGVPTSVGYGTNLDGFAPLLTMLNSCAAGVSVVNIDNGFGAGYIASMINAQTLLTQ